MFNHSECWGPYKQDMINDTLCGRTLGDAEQVTISRIGNGHDTGNKLSIQDTKSQPWLRRRGTHPTRNNFPAAVPRVTFVPEK